MKSQTADTVDARKLSATYSSGLFHDALVSPDVLSTLAVFYDEVCFPYPYGLDPQGVVFWRWEDHELGLQYPPGSKAFPTAQEMYAAKENEWKLLFEQGIFKKLPPPILDPQDLPEDFTKDLMRRLGYPEDQSTWRSSDILSGKFALALHAMYTQKPSPELFVSNPSDTSTTRLAGFLVQSVFRCVVPHLSSLKAEQILEVRELLKDTKEGFTYFIFEMADDVEGRIRSGDLTEVEAAKRSVERKLLPQYAEMRRQLEAKHTGFWANVLATGASILQIDATPWTPKFYGQVLEAFFGPIGKTAEAEEQARSNANQAFQYVTKLAESLPEKVIGESPETMYRNSEFTIPS